MNVLRDAQKMEDAKNEMGYMVQMVVGTVKEEQMEWCGVWGRAIVKLALEGDDLRRMTVKES